MGRITELGETLLHFGVGQTCIDLFVQSFNDFTRCILWCANPQPATCLIPRYKLIDCGDVRQRIQARRRGHRQRPQAASANKLNRVGDRIEGDLHLTTDQIGQHLRLTAIRHMDQIDPCHALK
jgi:hypothetical protein